jgi:tRNA(Ile)-lysidine synthetase-like protein
MQKEVIRSLIRCVKGDKENITARHVGDILGLCDRASGKQIHLPDSIRMRREFGHLRFTGTRFTVADFSYQIRIPGEIFIPETAKKVTIRPAGNKSRFPSFCTNRDQLTIRNRRPGDEYPTGIHQKSRSLKRLFIDLKIPLSYRSRLLVFECEKKIVWVEGLAPLNLAENTGQKRYEIEIGDGR